MEFSRNIEEFYRNLVRDHPETLPGCLPDLHAAAILARIFIIRELADLLAAGPPADQWNAFLANGLWSSISQISMEQGAFNIEEPDNMPEVCASCLILPI